VLTRRSNVSPKHKSCKVRGSSPTPGEAMSAKLAAIHWPGHHGAAGSLFAPVTASPGTWPDRMFSSSAPLPK